MPHYLKRDAVSSLFYFELARLSKIPIKPKNSWKWPTSEDNIFSQKRQNGPHVSIFLADNVNNFWYGIVAILVDKALGLRSECLNGLLGPPRKCVSIAVVLSSLIVKSVSNFVTNDHSNGSIIQVPFWKYSTLFFGKNHLQILEVPRISFAKRKERRLQNSRWKSYKKKKIFQIQFFSKITSITDGVMIRRVKSIDNGGLSQPNISLWCFSKALQLLPRGPGLDSQHIFKMTLGTWFSDLHTQHYTVTVIQKLFGIISEVLINMIGSLFEAFELERPNIWPGSSKKFQKISKN